MALEVEGLSSQAGLALPGDVEPSILAVDPGGTTGVAWAPWSVLDGVWTKAKSETVRYEEIPSAPQFDVDPEISTANRLLLRIRKVNARVVILENNDHFLLRGGTPLKSEALIPLRINAYVKFGLTHKWLDVKVIEPTPSGAMTTITDERLRKMDLWIRGKPHARDAIRHLLTEIRKLKKELK